MVTETLARLFRWRRPARRELIVNADDFGMSASVNRGIIKAVEHGIVTSVSLMVRRERAADAASYARSNRRISVGLHVDLGEWIRRNDQWEPLYAVVDLEDRAAVVEHVRLQLAQFGDLVGRIPTHLDSHQHVHRDEPVRSVMLDVARELDVPLRHFTTAVRYCGQFYGQERHGEDAHEAIGVDRLVDLVAQLDAGVTELCCHPGADLQEGEQYGRARPAELATLCNATVRRAVSAHAIRLRTFHGLRAAIAPDGGLTDLN
jgi:predicted glycoside hydrolase/deacetylase ChbG (UPF0249 family)